MVVAGSNVGDDGAQGIERRAVAFLQLALHVLAYLVHGYMAGAFDKGLHVLGPGTLHQLAHGVELATSYCAQISQMSSKCS